MKAIGKNGFSSWWKLILPIAMALLCSPVRSANRTWDGAGILGTNDWSNGGLALLGGNWSNAAAPVAGDALFFGGTSKLTPNNDIAADTNFAGITFNAGAGAYTLDGNRITLGGNVTNNSSNLQTINLDMILSATRTFTTVSGGDLTIGGVLSETGGSNGIVISGAGIATLSGANTYTGGTTINAGTLSLGSSGALGNSGTIGFGSGTLQYSVSNTTDYSSRFSTAASQAYKIDTNGQDVSFANALTSSGGTLTKSGTGKLTLTNAGNTYSGATTVNAGTLQIDGVITSAVMVNSNATLSGSGSVSKAITINGAGALRPGNKTPSGSGIGTFTLSGAGTDGDLAVAATGTLGLQLEANGIAFANQATSVYTSPGVLNSAYVNAANLQANANDRILVSGTLTLTGGSIIDVTLNGYTPTHGDAFDVLDWATLALGTFAIGPSHRTGTAADNTLYDLHLPDITAVDSSYTWDVSLFASHGIIVVAPEPSRATLLMTGLAVFFLRRRRL